MQNFKKLSLWHRVTLHRFIGMQYPRAVVRKSCGKQTLLILSSVCLFIISVWAVAVFYSTYTITKDVMKEISIQQVSETFYFTDRRFYNEKKIDKTFRAPTEIRKPIRNTAEFITKMQFDTSHRLDDHTAIVYHVSKII